MSDKNATKINVQASLAIAALIGAVASPFINWGSFGARLSGLEKKAEAQEEVINPKLWIAISQTREDVVRVNLLANRHDAVIPQIVSDVQEIKKDVKEIARAVKA